MEDEVEVFFLSFLAKDFSQEEERNEEILSKIFFQDKDQEKSWSKVKVQWFWDK